MVIFLSLVGFDTYARVQLGTSIPLSVGSNLPASRTNPSTPFSTPLPPKIQLGDLGSAVSSHSGVRVRAPAANAFLALKTHLMATFLVVCVQCKWLFCSSVKWKFPLVN